MEPRNGSNRGSLTGVVIEELQDTDGDGDPDVSDPDDDGDGMTDTWENAHSLNKLLDDRAGNPDLDAYDNWSEYVTDTNPRDGDSKQTFRVELAPGQVPTVRFSTSTRRRYAVAYCNDPNAESWLDLDPGFPGSGS